MNNTNFKFETLAIMPKQEIYMVLTMFLSGTHSLGRLFSLGIHMYANLSRVQNIDTENKLSQMFLNAFSSAGGRDVTRLSPTSQLYKEYINWLLGTRMRRASGLILSLRDKYMVNTDQKMKVVGEIYEELYEMGYAQSNLVIKALIEVLSDKKQYDKWIYVIVDKFGGKDHTDFVREIEYEASIEGKADLSDWLRGSFKGSFSSSRYHSPTEAGIRAA